MGSATGRCYAGRLRFKAQGELQTAKVNREKWLRGPVVIMVALFENKDLIRSHTVNVGGLDRHIATVGVPK